MDKNTIENNFFIFKELGSDSIGKNFRVGEIQDNKPVTHKLLTEVHPFLFQRPEVMNNANILFERIKSAKVPNLCAPEKVVKEGDKTFLISPFIKGKTLDQIFEESTKKNIPIKFELAFSIAIAIASLIEYGSAIGVRGADSFHGFLTPDNIIIDYDGNIFLKYFGLWLFLDENDEAVSEMIKKYGAWLTPEFIRGEQIVNRSDFYHLGYIVYRMLTGNYFSYLPGEDFESTFTSISFTSDLPSTDIEFLTDLIEFFKKTLSPDLTKRFSGVKEFKNYISKYFHIETLPNFQSSLATYMQLLYYEPMDEEEKALTDELAHTMPEMKEIYGERAEDKLLEDITIDLSEKKSSKTKFAFLVIFLAAVIAVSTYLIIDQTKKAKKEQQIAEKLLKEQDKEKKEFKRTLSELTKKLQTLEQQKTTTTVENQTREKEIARLKELKAEEEKKEKLRLKAIKDAQEKKKKEKKPAKTGKETEKTVIPVKEEIKKAEPPKVYQEVSLSEVTKKPVKLSGENPEFSLAVKKTYAGRRATVRATLLIDENGKVSTIEIYTEIPSEIKSEIIETLKIWKYKPAKRNNDIVRVWFPVKMKIYIK